MNLIFLGAFIGVLLWLFGLYLSYLAYMVSRGWFQGKSSILNNMAWRFTHDKEEKN